MVLTLFEVTSSQVLYVLRRSSFSHCQNSPFRQAFDPFFDSFASSNRCGIFSSYRLQLLDRWVYDQPQREDTKRGIKSRDQMVICSLHADIVYKSLSSNLVVRFQHVMDVSHGVLYGANVSFLQRVTRAEGKAIVLF